MSVDELTEYGLVEMDDAAIRAFLSTQKMGVLGLPDDVPYLLPMSFGYDGESQLYVTYVTGGTSRKQQLSETADGVSFLVFSVDTPYNWESVLLTGRLDAVPESEWESLEDVLEQAWRPTLFDGANLSGGVTVYEFTIEDQTGVKHTGLPPGFTR